MIHDQDVRKVIDALTGKLLDSMLGDYTEERSLVADVAYLVKDIISTELGEFGAVRVRGEGKGRIASVWAWGAEFWPDIAVEVRGLPTVAITVRLAGKDDDLSEMLARAVGSAIVHSVQYSYAIPFVLDQAASDSRQHWFDSEIDERLWTGHRVSLVVSRSGRA